MKMKFLESSLAISFFLVVMILPSKVANSFENEGDDFENQPDEGMHRLLRHIFKDYNKEIVPSRPVYVQLDVLLLKVNTTVERDGTFETVVALLIEWSDTRMAWNPSEYDNVTVLAIDSKKVWLPDIAMTNSAEHLYGVSRDTQFVVRLTYDGVFKFVPTGIARTWCELTLITFPFDMQTCSLEFESWSLDSSTMVFNDTASIVVDPNFLSTQWTLCNQSANVYSEYYPISGETFSRVRYDLLIKRKSTFYMVNLVFPCATLSVIQLFIFAIPSKDSSTDRINFGTVNLLSLFFFQTMITEELPRSDTISVLSKYIIALVLLAALGIFESVFVERLVRMDDRPPPRWCLCTARFFLLILGRRSGYEKVEDSVNKIPSVVENSKCVRFAVKIEGGGESGRLSVRGGSIHRRKLSRVTAAMVQHERHDFIREHHAELWEQVGTALDILTCILSTVAAIAMPVRLFLPLVNYGEEC